MTEETMSLADRVRARRAAAEQEQAAPEEKEPTVIESVSKGRKQSANPPKDESSPEVDTTEEKSTPQPAPAKKPRAAAKTKAEKQIVAAKAKAEKEATGGYTLLLDCLPDKGAMRDGLVNVVCEISAEIARQNDVEHWAEAGSDAFWTDRRTMLEKKVEQVLKSGIIQGYVTFDTHSYYWGIVGHLFIKHADSIIRGRSA